mmetsp:Transcript_23042/g.28579  ORF Transcript_23042/g.28579 Transcript_23042/m.28579 type:complete len:158 (-) Transcript_23042:62-535(-)
MSLGIFGIFLAILVSGLLLYFMLNLMAFRFTCCKTVKQKLRAKLFYSVWIRYMTESYLKMSHSCIFYFMISATFASAQDRVSSAVRITLLTILVVWPFFVTAFLLCNRKHLETAIFKRKFISMYNGLKIKQTSALLYTLFFCSRRIMIVLALSILQG